MRLKTCVFSACWISLRAQWIRRVNLLGDLYRALQGELLQTRGSRGSRVGAAKPRWGGGPHLWNSRWRPWILNKSYSKSPWGPWALPGVKLCFTPAGKVWHCRGGPAMCSEHHSENLQNTVRRTIPVFFSSLRILHSSTKAEATNCWAEFKTTKETAETWLKAVCRKQHTDLLESCLSSQCISVLHLCGRNSVSPKDQEKEEDKSQRQVWVPTSHSEFAKCTRWRAADCIPELQAKQGNDSCGSEAADTEQQQRCCGLLQDSHSHSCLC